MERIYLQQIDSVKNQHPKYKAFKKIIKEKMNNVIVKWGGGNI